ncbi:hypothetical protein [Curtobacterium flaccumfaciens]|uniref:hypothetical protein n=1 Tax=Curtobacterium flaccumfaciens TaxID=2035 RepID=UPI001BDEB9E8|nr:hypothetical protein [Curtobacterium flaccumfaciens]MBT1631567.1 hypothetical protein [Curtobacterium flaccumfaciens pv. oortii]MCS5524641.1 hypothetical protein [Curtobacterium flaccumfaciens pv. oortii]MCX2847010.1 hypothetical protein [Curtobacterium flaccumfaciens pv. oortii]
MLDHCVIEEKFVQASIAIMRSALIAAGIFTIALGGTLAVPSAAQAQSGYRVCGVFNGAQGDYNFGTGLVTKVWKGDDSGTCDSKIDYMKQYYGAAWDHSDAVYTYRMFTCEAFAKRTGTPGDPCDDMIVNKIYRSYSKFDLRYPQAIGRVTFWHN